MINELYSLAKTLETMDISVDEWHRSYKPLPKATAKKPCIRIWLEEDGSVSELEALPTELAAVLRKFGDNQSAFPAFNLSALYRTIDPDVISSYDELLHGRRRPQPEELRRWCICDNWRKSAVQVRRCMSDRADALMDLLPGEPETDILAKLATLSKLGCEGFRASLERYLIEKLSAGEDIALLLPMLLYPGAAEKKPDADTGEKISVILDVRHWQQYGRPVANEQTTRRLNQILLESGESSELSEQAAEDAFGTPFINPEEPMPNVKLSGFEVTLRSMFDGQPCQNRYRTINDASYPIAPQNRSSLKKSLEWLAAPEHRQSYWEKTDKSELLFVYPSKLPEIAPHFAAMLCRSPEGTEKRFQAVSASFVQTLHGLPSEQQPNWMQIFILRKIDKGRSKVIFTHCTTPERLVAAAQAWQDGCANLPPMRVGGCPVPFPLDAASIVNAVWKQNGERADGKAAVSMMKRYQGIELLLELLPMDAAARYLHLLLEHLSGLIQHLGDELPRSGASTDKQLESKKAEAGRAFPLLGLLLQKCEIRKENYMDSLAFALGQLLHVSDELHILYCKVKRNKKIPPQLVGNSFFVHAGVMPFQALGQLGIRMRPYLDWAKTYWANLPEDSAQEQTDLDPEEKKTARLARYYSNLYREIADTLHPQMTPSVRFGDYERAELFIGYLASLPQRKTMQKEEHNNTTGGKKNDN